MAGIALTTREHIVIERKEGNEGRQGERDAPKA